VTNRSQGSGADDLHWWYRSQEKKAGKPAAAFLKRVDDYLSLFFIPIFRIRKGEPFIECDRCGHISDERGFAISPGIDLRDSRCRQCGANVEKDFKYCPYCGGRL